MDKNIDYTELLYTRFDVESLHHGKILHIQGVDDRRRSKGEQSIIPRINTWMFEAIRRILRANARKSMLRGCTKCKSEG